jgi:hypothetical protein
MQTMMKGVAGGTLPPQAGGMSAKLARAAARRLPAGELPPQLQGFAGAPGAPPSGLGSLGTGRTSTSRGGTKKKKGGRVTPPKHR